LEFHPIGSDPPQAGKAEDLKSAAVGQQRAVPALETVQSTGGGDAVFARPKVQVIGIPEDKPVSHLH
jgi:hypothetical protein